MINNDYFFLFTEEAGSMEKPRWLMSVTMIFGSMVAGATSEGGGAVAFPVMTLALGVAPPVARDFSFMIQSIVRKKFLKILVDHCMKRSQSGSLIHFNDCFFRV
jgi:hypothetical protein